ncbi:unnamed protein product [Rangifer tarandus platyrhynchus]|uniref:Uncharacterized protein n=1 Tax=Rangifer tarandus platyrhynchus TaxID=3082113 RepID=A0ABN8XJP4_RANTA|nr:unnamed protein product [Rangifer tarandus platyrhynchus]
MRATVSALLYSACAVFAIHCTDTVSAASGSPPPPPADEEAARKDAAARSNDLQFMDLLKHTIESQVEIFPERAASLRNTAFRLDYLRRLFHRAYHMIRFRPTTTPRARAVSLAEEMHHHLEMLRRPMMDDVLFGQQYFHMLEGRVQYVVYRLNNLQAP